VSPPDTVGQHGPAIVHGEEFAVAKLNVCLFGKLSLKLNGYPLPGFDARKLQQLLCYLLLHRDHPQPREALASLFWGDTSTEQSKKHLRQTLWQLQSTLTMDEQAGHHSLLTVNAEWVGLQSSTDLWLDVATFEDAFTPIQDIPGHDLGVARAQLLESAVQLYQGDLLEGWYDDWCLFERERLQNMFLAMLDKLMGHCESNQQYETAIVYGTRILSFDRAREHTHRALMRLHCLAGNRTAALRQYERCSAALEEELGVKPSRSTCFLYEEIKEDRIYDATLWATEISGTQRLDLANRLEQISRLLTEVRAATAHGLQEIELLMKRRR
jgi:DNA-binding SARP family transcriptional activator